MDQRFSIAQLYFSNKIYQKSNELCNDLLAEGFRQPRLLHLKALNCLYFNNQPGEAQEFLIQSLAAQPINVDAWIDLGHVLVATGDFDQALKAYQSALKIDPYNSTAYNGLALTQAGLGNIQTAIETLNLSIQANLNDMTVMTNLRKLLWIWKPVVPPDDFPYQHTSNLPVRPRTAWVGHQYAYVDNQPVVSITSAAVGAIETLKESSEYYKTFFYEELPTVHPYDELLSSLNHLDLIVIDWFNLVTLDENPSLDVLDKIRKANVKTVFLFWDTVHLFHVKNAVRIQPYADLVVAVDGGFWPKFIKEVPENMIVLWGFLIYDKRLFYCADLAQKNIEVGFYGRLERADRRAMVDYLRSKGIPIRSEIGGYLDAAENYIPADEYAEFYRNTKGHL